MWCDFADASRLRLIAARRSLPIRTMNAPDEQAHIVLAPGLEKVVYNADTKVPNAGTFTIRNEDHTYVEQP